MFSFIQCHLLVEASRTTAPSESHTERPASASLNWLPELLNMSALVIHSQISQAPAASDRGLSASTHEGWPCKVFIICRLLHRVDTSCGVILSHGEIGHVFRAPGKGHL